MLLQGPQATIRPYHQDDLPRLVQLANNRAIWRNMKDIFPHPYSHANAEWWLDHTARQGQHPTDCAIEVDGQFAGGIGAKILTDVQAHTREIGYWIAQPYWGRGIATEAVGLWTAHLFENPAIHRLQARVFAWNPASARVLEKNNFQCEGRLRDAIYKDNTYTDALLYARLQHD